MNPPPYLDAALALGLGTPRGEVTDVFVLHDDPCALLAGTGPCNCTPTATLGYVLWFRAGRRKKWELIGTAATESAAWKLTRTSNRKGGDWCCLPAGKQP